MLRTLQDRINHYHNNTLSLKRQTICENGTQSHGPRPALTGTLENRKRFSINPHRVHEAAGLPAPKEDFMTGQAAGTGGLKWGEARETRKKGISTLRYLALLTVVLLWYYINSGRSCEYMFDLPGHGCCLG